MLVFKIVGVFLLIMAAVSALALLLLSIGGKPKGPRKLGTLAIAFATFGLMGCNKPESETTDAQRQFFHDEMAAYYNQTLDARFSGGVGQENQFCAKFYFYDKRNTPSFPKTIAYGDMRYELSEVSSLPVGDSEFRRREAIYVLQKETKLP
jgi:hypothetical protein